MTFVDLKSDPDQTLGPELGLFDRRGMLAVSYRRIGGAYHVWAYNRDDAGIARFFILDSEARARALCETLLVARDHGADDGDPDTIINAFHL